MYTTLSSCLKTEDGESMRIVINATVTSQREKTGIATFGTNLLKALKELDDVHSYCIFTLNDPDLEKMSNREFDVRTLPGIFRFLPVEFSWICWYLWYYTGFNLQLGSIKPDAYLSLDFSLPGYKNCPRVCMVYDLTPLLLEGAYPERFKTRYKMQVAHAIKNADRVITISQSARKDILEYFGVDSQKVEVVYPGFDDNLFTATKDPGTDKKTLDRYGINYPYILFIGALEPKKNIIRLIDAFEKVKKDGRIPHRLVIGGKRSWNDAAVFEKITTSTMRSEINYAGYLPNQDLPALMRNADLFIFPSLNEGFGIPPLEAMACGTPVITSTVSSLPEVVADAGILIDPYNVEEMAAVITRVLSSDDLRQAMVRKGLERAKLFSWHKAAHDMLEIISEVSGR